MIANIFQRIWQGEVPALEKYWKKLLTQILSWTQCWPCTRVKIRKFCDLRPNSEKLIAIIELWHSWCSNVNNKVCELVCVCVCLCVCICICLSVWVWVDESVWVCVRAHDQGTYRGVQGGTRACRGSLNGQKCNNFYDRDLISKEVRKVWGHCSNNNQHSIQFLW